jgi:hypothetical protein
MAEKKPPTDPEDTLLAEKESLDDEHALTVELLKSKEDYLQLEDKLKRMKNRRQAIKEFFSENSSALINDTNQFTKLKIIRSDNNNYIFNLSQEDIDNMDEPALIARKKAEYLEKGIELIKFRKDSRAIETIHGKLKIIRTILRPKTKEGLIKLIAIDNIKSIAPLDEYLGLNHLPFKITLNAMVEIAYWVQSSDSYDDAEDVVRCRTKINVKNDTMRFVTNYIGSIVFNNDLTSAEKTYAAFASGGLEFSSKKQKGDLYIDCDTVKFHAREKDERGGTWKENMFGVIFNSDSFIYQNDDNTVKKFAKVEKCEYVACAGSREVFQKLLFNSAINNGYRKYSNTILIFNGDSWVKNMKDIFFPDAILILNSMCLFDKIDIFAKEYFNNDKKKYIKWSNKIRHMLHDDKINEVLNLLNALNIEKVNKCKFNLKTYILQNKNYINYKQYKANGWFICTDMIGIAVPVHGGGGSSGEKGCPPGEAGPGPCGSGA